MKHTINILLLFGLVLTSCSKKQGCRDVKALNYDASAEADGTCKYTNVIFYAGSNKVGGFGILIDSIEVYRLIVDESELIGKIKNLADSHPAPVGCSPSEKSVQYMFSSGDMKDTRFSTRYYYKDGSSESGTTHILSPEKNTECILKNLTL